MSRPGKTERLLSAIALLPISAKAKQCASTLRDLITSVRMIRELMRSEEEE